MTTTRETEILAQLGYTPAPARQIILVARETVNPTWLIAFRNDQTWSLNGELCSRSGLIATCPDLLGFNVPVVTTNGTNDEQRRAIFAKHSDPKNPAGWLDIPGMIDELKAIGCRVQYPRKHFLSSVPGAFDKAPAMDMND